MPYSRKTYSQLKTDVANDISGQLQGADPLLRKNILGVLGKIVSRMANLLYGYLDWIAKNAVPFSATAAEYILGWGGLKGVTLKNATLAGSTGGAVTFINCTIGVPVPDATPLVRGDQFQFKTVGLATVDGTGTLVANVIAINPGGAGNSPVNTVLTLGTAIAGMQSSGKVSTAITGGSDTETIDAYKSRMLQVYQNPPQGGAAADYKIWALQVPGVTRAWVYPLAMGPGTVTVRFMMDIAEAGNGGFPVGTDGVAAAETRATPATGDQLAVANYIYGDINTARQPVGALVYAVSPIPDVIAFTIAHISTVGADVKAAIAAAIDGVFLEFGVPGGTIDLSDLEAAIAAVPGTEGFVITVPSDNIVLPAGNLPQRGVITYT